MKAVILNILFCALAFWSMSQKGAVVVSVENDEVLVNTPFAVSIKSSVEGDVVENWPSNFSRGYGVQTMSRYVQDVNTGKMIQEHIVVFTGAFTKAGKYKIGPFYVKAGNKTYTSNSVKINVTDSPTSKEDLSRQQLKQPAFGVVEVSSSKLYEGEPLVIWGRVYARERTFGRPVLRRPFNVDGVNDNYALQQIEQWESTSVKGKNYESFSFEKKVLFPVGSGKLTIQPFEMYLPFSTQDFNVVASVPSVEVLPLPANAPNEFIGAVGEFDIIQKHKASNVKQGDIIQVELVVSGSGNLHAIEIPTLPLPRGMRVYGDPEIKEDYTFTQYGASGKITYTYFVQVTKEGKHTIQPTKIAFFNPKSEKYVTVSGDHPIVVDVQHDENFVMTALEDSIQVVDTNVDTKLLDKEAGNSSIFSDNIPMWIGIGGVSVLAAGLLFLFLFKRKSNDSISQNSSITVANKSENVVKKGDLLTAITELENTYQLHVSEDYYAGVENVLNLYMRYSLQLDKVTYYGRMELLEQLREKGNSNVHFIEKTYAECDAARYGLGGNDTDQSELLHKIKTLL